MRFTGGVNVSQLRHTLFLQMWVKITGMRTGIQLRRNNIVPRGATRFGGTRHGENQRFVGHARHRARLQRRGANLFKRQHTEHFAKAFHFSVKQRQQRFRCIYCVISSTTYKYISISELP